jgi:hypothetical protein
MMIINGIRTYFAKLLNSSGSVIDPATYTAQTDGSHKTQIVDAVGDTIDIKSAYPDGTEKGIPVKSVDGLVGLVDSGNTSSVALSAGATFTGTALDTLPYSSVVVQIYANVASATNGMSCQWSPDGTNWDTVRQFTIPAATWLNFTHSVHGRYFRIVYINGASNQTTFRLQTVKSKIALTGEIIPIEAQPVAGCDALLTKSIISGKTTAGGGAYVDVKVNPSGALTTETSVTSSALPTDAATATNQTSGDQKTQIVASDGSVLEVYTRTQTPAQKVIGVQIGPGDIVSNLPVVVDYEHHQVHEGETHHSIDQQLSLGTNTVKYEITVPTFNPADASRCPHMMIEVDVYNGAARCDFYENPGAATGGSSMTIFNRERNIATTPGTSVKTGVTITGGTLIESFFSGSGSKAVGGNRSGTEWILKSNETYRVDLVGLTSGTQAIVTFGWYEDLGV